MSDIVPSYLPEQYNVPIDNALERKKSVTEARNNTLQPLMIVFLNHLFECNMDIATAAMRTGIKTSKAREWVEKDGPVADKIIERLNEMSLAAKVTVEKVIEGLYEEATRLPAHDKDITVTHAARVSAWSILAKYKGMLDKGAGNRKQNVSVNINIEGDATIKGDE